MKLIILKIHIHVPEFSIPRATGKLGGEENLTQRDTVAWLLTLWMSSKMGHCDCLPLSTSAWTATPWTLFTLLAFSGMSPAPFVLLIYTLKISDLTPAAPLAMSVGLAWTHHSISLKTGFQRLGLNIASFRMLFCLYVPTSFVQSSDTTDSVAGAVAVLGDTLGISFLIWWWPPHWSL